MKELLKVILPKWGVIFTASNSYSKGDLLNKRIKEYCLSNKNAKFYESLGRIGYINAVRNIDLVVGNSSSGIYEVPSLKKPSINM